MAGSPPETPRPGGGGFRRALRTPVAIAAIAALVGVSAVAVRAFADTSRGCNAPIKLSIAVAPDIANAVSEAAARWAGTNSKVNGQCVRVAVTPMPSADVAKIITARAGGRLPGSNEAPVPPQESDVPAVWIPESISWLARTRGVDRNAFDAATPSVAMSPVVLATQEAFATSTLAGKPSLTTTELSALLKKNGKDGVTIATADPDRDAGGLAGVAVLRDLLAPSADKASAAVAAYRSIAVSPDTAELLKTVKAKTVVPVTEQAVVAYNANVNSPALPLNVIPLEHGFSLDYPLAVVSGKALGVLRAARQFRTALTSPEYRNILSREGFRAPDGTVSVGFPLEHGVTGDPVTPSPLNDAARVDEVLNYWSAARIPSRVLSLVDVTSSMKQPMKVASGAAATRMEVLRKTAITGLSLFGDSSEMGLWTYGSTSKELVGVAPLAAAQRAKLTAAVTGATAGPTDTCALYDAILTAYKAMRDGYHAGVSNTMVVFTDGSNNAKTGLTADQLRVELEKASDPTKPVRVVLLGLGSDANMDQLNAIAGYIGGKAFAVQDPAQINDIFLQALLRG